MRVLLVGADLVLPRRFPSGWAFATLGAREWSGYVAVVDERAEETPLTLARADLGPLDPLTETEAGASVLQELAWLDSLPVGSEVRITSSGTQRVRVGAEHLDYHRQASAKWATQERRRGHLPVLLVQGDRVRVLSLPWRGPLGVVDLDTVRAKLPQYGVPGPAEHVEVL